MDKGMSGLRFSLLASTVRPAAVSGWVWQVWQPQVAAVDQVSWGSRVLLPVSDGEVSLFCCISGIVVLGSGNVPHTDAILRCLE